MNQNCISAANFLYKPIEITQLYLVNWLTRSRGFCLVTDFATFIEIESVYKVTFSHTFFCVFQMYLIQVHMIRDKEHIQRFQWEFQGRTNK